MNLIKTAITRGFLTQVLAWGMFGVWECEFLRWMISPGFAVSKIAGDTFALAVILAVNWFIFTCIWVVLLLAARVLFPAWVQERVVTRAYDPYHGYHEE
jgi:hypothetical protein